MKKEFGKWFLDLAKYILTGIILTAFFAKMEQNIVLWGALAFFSISIVVGYILLVQADNEKLPIQDTPNLSGKSVIEDETQSAEEGSTRNNKKKSNKRNKK